MNPSYSDANGSGEGAGVGWAIDHMEEARALLDKPGVVRLEKGAPKDGREGGEGAEGLSGNSAVTSTECDQVAEAADRGGDCGGGR
jgi:hypothetical protein